MIIEIQMDKFKDMFGVFLISLAILYSVGIYLGCFKDIESCEQIEQSVFAEEVYVDTWPLFIEALIWVESRGDDGAKGSANDGGCLQITPIYVAEANGILGRRGYYTLEDRFVREKAIEIFNVVNAYHNPERDVERAIRLHNPGAGAAYRDEVIGKYNEFIEK